MRTADEIQAAHDLLVQQLLNEVPRAFTDDDEPVVKAAADVLCWVLSHSHNVAFGENLASMNEYLAAQGYVLRRETEPRVRGQCVNCHKPMNPVESMLGPVCGDCARAGHARVTG